MTPLTPRHRKRPKSNPQNPNSLNPNYNSPISNSISSSSTLTSLLSQIEPPPNFIPSKSDLFKLAVVVVIATAVAAVCNFIAAALHRTPIPFCDSDAAEFDYFVSDSCEPCPSNGRCYNGQLECIQGYRKYGKLCIEDGDIYEIAKKISEQTKDHLCKEYAHYICDGTGAIWVSMDDLKNMLDGYKLAKGSPMDDARYMYIMERAMDDIYELVDARTADDGIKEFKCPDILVESYKPVACRARQWIAHHFLVLTFSCALLAVCTLTLVRIRRRYYLTKRAEHLYHQVCDILEDNALMSKSEIGREPWLVASRLRDHLLSTKERRDPHLWKKVEELVELDSRVDCYPNLVKGESKVVWEWQVEGSLSSSGKKVGSSYRVSGAPTKNLSDKKQQSVEITLDYNELRQMS
ncbi:hypothetical protein RND81_08G139400 [Saponaria officinalis]|uniref:Man1/Src1-like C-terminal domain-containing protein n=2 Tax=Saponaria officinalis TaxID=3572 RepID=A0AAW1J740_SAPOF